VRLEKPLQAIPTLFIADQWREPHSSPEKDCLAVKLESRVAPAASVIHAQSLAGGPQLICELANCESGFTSPRTMTGSR